MGATVYVECRLAPLHLAAHNIIMGILFTVNFVERTVCPCLESVKFHEQLTYIHGFKLHDNQRSR